MTIREQAEAITQAVSAAGHAIAGAAAALDAGQPDLARLVLWLGAQAMVPPLEALSADLTRAADAQR